jgi:hypothetical protein
VKSAVKKTKGEIISIEGKKLCGQRSIHMVSAWGNANKMVMGQVRTDEKSNEITAIPKLLEVLEIKGCIITIEAMGCQKEISRKITEKKAEYVL